MRVIASIILICIVLFGCNKQGDVTPGGTSANNTKPGGTPIIPPVDSSNKLTREDSIHMAAFIIYAQKVKTSVSDRTLKLVLDEDVNIFILQEAYKRTSAVHLLEDFKTSALPAFDFTTVNGDGQTNFNYVDDNLNNVKLKSIKDTVINGIDVVKVNVHRPFTFSKVYNSNQLATDQQNLLLNRTNDIITFSSYTYYNQKNYPVTAAVARITYVK